LVHLFGVPPQPWLDRRDVEAPRFQQADHPLVDRHRLRADPPSIHAKEDIGGRESDSLVAVDERVIHRKALEERRGFPQDVVVVPALRPEQGRLQRSAVTEAMGPAEALDEDALHEHDLERRKVKTHFASSRYNASYSARLSPRAVSTSGRGLPRFRFSMKSRSASSITPWSCLPSRAAIFRTSSRTSGSAWVANFVNGDGI